MKFCALEDGAGIDALDTMYPASLHVRRKGYFQAPTSTFYAIVPTQGIKGSVILGNGITINVIADQRPMVFCCPEALAVDFASPVVVIERYGYRGQVGMNVIEKVGRLSYIDGCSDSLLIYPSRMGDPCLNHLHFPQGILQTQHTHPSIRLGTVVGGKGYAWQKASEFSEGWEYPLVPGQCFLLEENELHSFKTPTAEMEVIAWHPDSDWGPTDANHPMLNRTYINHGR